MRIPARLLLMALTIVFLIGNATHLFADTPWQAEVTIEEAVEISWHLEGARSYEITLGDGRTFRPRGSQHQFAKSDVVDLGRLRINGLPFGSSQSIGQAEIVDVKELGQRLVVRWRDEMVTCPTIGFSIARMGDYPPLLMSYHVPRVSQPVLSTYVLSEEPTYVHQIVIADYDNHSSNNRCNAGASLELMHQVDEELRVFKTSNQVKSIWPRSGTDLNALAQSSDILDRARELRDVGYCAKVSDVDMFLRREYRENFESDVIASDVDFIHDLHLHETLAWLVSDSPEARISTLTAMIGVTGSERIENISPGLLDLREHLTPSVRNKISQALNEYEDEFNKVDPSISERMRTFLTDDMFLCQTYLISKGARTPVNHYGLPTNLRTHS
ncbi:MAG: hypothetical protein JJU48_05455 [Methylophaga sp.]|nr:hypothetical protein [Methylophaga sp.]